MKLYIKWISIDVDDKEHALKIIAEMESLFNNEAPYYQWDYEIQEG